MVALWNTIQLQSLIRSPCGTYRKFRFNFFCNDKFKSSACFCPSYCPLLSTFHNFSLEFYNSATKFRWGRRASVPSLGPTSAAEIETRLVDLGLCGHPHAIGSGVLGRERRSRTLGRGYTAGSDVFHLGSVDFQSVNLWFGSDFDKMVLIVGARLKGHVSVFLFVPGLLVLEISSFKGTEARDTPRIN